MIHLPDTDIRAALARITASEPFRNAPQMAGFLNFVVEKTLAGQQQALKGYTIATQALGRPANFDPQSDPIVRVEAGRLRRALSTYYAGQGREDPVRIVIPRGTYIPQFERHEPSGQAVAPEPAPVPEPAPGEPSRPEAKPAPPVRTAEAEPPARRPWSWFEPLVGGAVALAAAALLALALALAPSDWMVDSIQLGQTGSASDGLDGRPVVGVGRGETSGAAPEGFSADLMRSMIIDNLARFDHLVVIDLANGQTMPDRERYKLNLRVGSNARGGAVMARLTHEPSGTIVWVRSFELTALDDPSVTRETAISRQIATALAQPYGVLFADLRTRPTLSEGLRCTIQAYDYRSNPGPEAHARARDCLEALVAAHPHAAIALANLSYLYLDEYRVGFNARPNPLDRALQAARRAVEIAPESPRTNQALMTSLFVFGDTEHALSLGRRAMQLNPLDTDIMAELGARLIQAGQYDEGEALITRAADLNPSDPPWYDFFLFLSAYMKQNFQSARAFASRISAADYVLGLVAQAVIAVQDRQEERARELIARLVTLQPEFAVDAAGALARRNFAPSIQSRLLEALRQAGLRG